MQKEMIDIDEPKAKLIIFTYFKLIGYFIIAKILFFKAIVINLPYEVQYPYLFSNMACGFRFIAFGEMLKKIFGVKLIWKNSLPLVSVRDISVCWDLVPNGINLAINIKGLSRHPKLDRLKNKIVSIVKAKKNQIKLIYFDDPLHNLLSNFQSF